MQRQLGLAVVSIAVLSLSACSEADPDARRFRPTDVTGAAGGGGSANSGGSGGAPSGGTGGGSSGATSGGSSGASAGSGGAGPMSFSPPGCTGCLELDVVLDPAYRDPMDGMPRLIAMYDFQFAMTGLDMSNATVTWKLATLTPSPDVYVTPFAQNGAMPNNYAGVYRPQTPLAEANGFTASSSAFVDVVLDLANTAPLGAAAAPAGDAGAAGPAPLDNGGMDKSAIYQLGLQIGALNTLVAPTTVRLLLDAVTFTGVDGTNTMLRDRDFSDGPQDFVVNTYNLPPGSAGPTKY